MTKLEWPEGSTKGLNQPGPYIVIKPIVNVWFFPVLSLNGRYFKFIGSDDNILIIVVHQ